jgi:hypothetical protein
VPDVPYQWPIGQAATKRLSEIVGPATAGRIAAIEDGFTRRAALADKLRPLLLAKGRADVITAAKWIVKDWGGIRGGDDSRFECWLKAWAGFRDEAVQGFISKEPSGPSSWSKILAFARAERFAIYDARVVASLEIAFRGDREAKRFRFDFSPWASRNAAIREALRNVRNQCQEPLRYRDYLALLGRFAMIEPGLSLARAEARLFAAADELAQRARGG